MSPEDKTVDNNCCLVWNGRSSTKQIPPGLMPVLPVLSLLRINLDRPGTAAVEDWLNNQDPRETQVLSCKDQQAHESWKIFIFSNMVEGSKVEVKNCLFRYYGIMCTELLRPISIEIYKKLKFSLNVRNFYL